MRFCDSFVEGDVVAWSKVRQFSREQLIAELKRVVAVRGDVTFRAFQRAIGRSGAVLDGVFANWGELRLAAGLGSRRPGAMKLISDEGLIAEYRRVCQLLSRTPDDREFGELASCSMITLRKRFGDGAAIRRAASGVEDLVKEARPPHPDPLPRNEVDDAGKAGCGGEGEDGESRSWVVEWLSAEWKKVRVGLAWRSSFVVTAPRDAFDVVFCAEHDWAECPWPVVEWAKAVRSRMVPNGVTGADGMASGAGMGGGGESPSPRPSPPLDSSMRSESQFRGRGGNDAAEGIPQGDAGGTGSGAEVAGASAGGGGEAA